MVIQYLIGKLSVLVNLGFVRVPWALLSDIVILSIAIYILGTLLDVQKVKPGLGISDEPDYGQCFTTVGRLGMNIGKSNF